MLSDRQWTQFLSLIHLDRYAFLWLILLNTKVAIVDNDNSRHYQQNCSYFLI
jgi:hypothetical protein